jgi:hypothetical protein
VAEIGDLRHWQFQLEIVRRVNHGFLSFKASRRVCAACQGSSISKNSK